MYRQTKIRPKRQNNFRNSGYRNTGSRSRGGHKQDIHPSRFIKAAKPVQEIEVFVPTNKFADFEIHPLLKSNIISRGYELPSAIQDQAIPHGLAGRDIVGIANTGTGKTAAFAIPMLNKIINTHTDKALVVAPTRELAEQIQGECRSYAKGSGINGALLIGGTSMSAQIRDLRFNPSIVIGTPGRLKDHVQRGTLKLSDFTIVVLDEVDRMLDMGFITDIRFLLDQLSAKHQSYFFSATLDSKMAVLVQSFLNDPVTVSVKTGETCDNISQDIVKYSGTSDKMDKLHSSLLREKEQKTLIFDSTQRSVERLSKELQSRGFDVEAIHGGKTQGQRQRALAKFKENHINILVATDVAARGIDVVDITHVINYSQPNTYDDYIHRIGRAGRAGRIGQALTFIDHTSYTDQPAYQRSR